MKVKIKENKEKVIMPKCFYNYADESYWVQTDEGLTVGIGATKKEAIEEAEFWGLDCTNITFGDD